MRAFIVSLACALVSLADWGLYFYHFNRVRERCQLGHAGISGLDFTLGRFVKEAESDGYMRRGCKMNWRAYWKPPMSKAVAGANGVCNASTIPGYLTMCPGTPLHPIKKMCGVGTKGASGQSGADDEGGISGSKDLERAERKLQRSGGDGQSKPKAIAKTSSGAKGAASANLTRGLRRGMLRAAGGGAADTPSDSLGGVRGSRAKSARESLKELNQLKDEHLITVVEYEGARARLIDAVVARGVAGLTASSAAGMSS